MPNLARKKSYFVFSSGFSFRGTCDGSGCGVGGKRRSAGPNHISRSIVRMSMGQISSEI